MKREYRTVEAAGSNPLYGQKAKPETRRDVSATKDKTFAPRRHEDTEKSKI